MVILPQPIKNRVPAVRFPIQSSFPTPVYDIDTTTACTPRGPSHTRTPKIEVFCSNHRDPDAIDSASASFRSCFSTRTPGKCRSLLLLVTEKVVPSFRTHRHPACIQDCHCLALNFPTPKYTSYHIDVSLEKKSQAPLLETFEPQI